MAEHNSTEMFTLIIYHPHQKIYNRYESQIIAEVINNHVMSFDRIICIMKGTSLQMSLDINIEKGLTHFAYTKPVDFIKANKVDEIEFIPDTFHHIVIIDPEEISESSGLIKNLERKIGSLSVQIHILQYKEHDGEPLNPDTLSRGHTTGALGVTYLTPGQLGIHYVSQEDKMEEEGDNEEEEDYSVGPYMHNEGTDMERPPEAPPLLPHHVTKLPKVGPNEAVTFLVHNKTQYMPQSLTEIDLPYLFLLPGESTEHATMRFGIDKPFKVIYNSRPGKFPSTLNGHFSWIEGVLVACEVDYEIANGVDLSLISIVTHPKLNGVINEYLLTKGLAF